MSKLKVWTNDEVEFLKNNYINMSDKKIAKHLNRSCRSVQAKRQRLSLIRNKCRMWTTQEIQFLKEHASNLTIDELSEILSRSPSAVYPQLNQLGITCKAKLNQYALYDKDKLLAFGSVDDIAEQLGIKPTTVYYYGTPGYKRRKQNRVLIKI